MFINNNIANQSYVSYAKNVNNLQKSAERLASGDKFGDTGDGNDEGSEADSDFDMGQAAKEQSSSDDSDDSDDNGDDGNDAECGNVPLV